MQEITERACVSEIVDKRFPTYSDTPISEDDAIRRAGSIYLIAEKVSHPGQKGWLQLGRNYDACIINDDNGLRVEVYTCTTDLIGDLGPVFIVEARTFSVAIAPGPVEHYDLINIDGAWWWKTRIHPGTIGFRMLLGIALRKGVLCAIGNWIAHKKGTVMQFHTNCERRGAWGNIGSVKYRQYATEHELLLPEDHDEAMKMITNTFVSLSKR